MFLVLNGTKEESRGHKINTKVQSQKRVLHIVGSVLNASQIIETDKYRKVFYALTSRISSISCSKCVVFC